MHGPKGNRPKPSTAYRSKALCDGTQADRACFTRLLSLIAAGALEPGSSKRHGLRRRATRATVEERQPCLVAPSLTIDEFVTMFPDEDACCDYLFKARYDGGCRCTRCGAIGKWRKLSKMPAYTCVCGNHLHPMVGTPFRFSKSTLRKWFHAVFLFSTKRGGPRPSELQRQLAVHHSTARRMCGEIGKYVSLLRAEALQRADG
jgi:hypothetical protein